MKHISIVAFMGVLLSSTAFAFTAKDLIGEKTGRVFGGQQNCTMKGEMQNGYLILTITEEGREPKSLPKVRLSKINKAIEKDQFLVYVNEGLISRIRERRAGRYNSEWYVRGHMIDDQLHSIAIVHNWTTNPLGVYGGRQDSATCTHFGE